MASSGVEWWIESREVDCRLIFDSIGDRTMTDGESRERRQEFASLADAASRPRLPSSPQRPASQPTSPQPPLIERRVAPHARLRRLNFHRGYRMVSRALSSSRRSRRQALQRLSSSRCVFIRQRRRSTTLNDHRRTVAPSATSKRATRGPRARPPNKGTRVAGLAAT